MKAAGFFLLFAGFIIVMGGLVLLPASSPRGAFVASGVAIQVLGLFLTFRAHYTQNEGH